MASTQGNLPLSRTDLTGSFRIRAPLSLDDDDDGSSGYESNKDDNFNGNYDSSGSGVENGSETEEFRSVEEFESASDRPFVEEIPEENGGFVDRNQVSRPSLDGPDEESLEVSIEEEEESGVTNEYSPNLMPIRPVAQLSMDDDDEDELASDEGTVSEVEDGRFSGVVKVPSYGVLERVFSGPRIKGLDVEEDKDDELESLSVRDNEDLVLGKFIGAQSDVPESNDSVSFDVIEDGGHVDAPETEFEPSVEGKEGSVEENGELDNSVRHLVGESVSIELVEHEGPEASVRSLLYCKEDVLAENSSLEEKVSGLGGGDGHEAKNVAFDPLNVLSKHSGAKQQIANKISNHSDNGREAVLNPVNESAHAIVPAIQEVRVEELRAESIALEKDSHNEKMEGLLSKEDIKYLIFGGTGTTSNTRDDSEQSLDSGAEKERMVTELNDKLDTAEELEGKDFIDSATFLADFLKAAVGDELDGSSITETPLDGSKELILNRSAGSGTSFRPMRLATSSGTVKVASKDIVTKEEKKIENIQHLRTKFLRVVHRLGYSPEDSIAAQVLHRLGVAPGGHGGQNFGLQLEADVKDELDFSLNILVLGKTGVGKSATINSIFGQNKVAIDAFEPGTIRIKEIMGTVNGVRIRIIDTPGLRSPVKEEATNRKILASIKNSIKKFPPDVVLYVDRLDNLGRDLDDLPLLKSLTNCLTASIWRNAVITLTHAASPPPDGPFGSSLSFEVFVAQRSHAVQLAISQAVGDLRLMHPVALVDNHTSCEKNKMGESILPNGQSWRPQLLLLCYSLKILSELSSLSKPQDAVDQKKRFGFRSFTLPLSHLVSSLLQSRPHPKLSADQGGGDVDSDIELSELWDSDEEDGDEYDELPPFRPLRKSQVHKLSKEQRRAYFEEYNYRVKLFQKKQWREEIRRLKERKKKDRYLINDYGHVGEDLDPEEELPAAVPVPMPDFVLPPSFDSDDPNYRYRSLRSTSEFLVRPVLDSQGWDHDCGYDGISVERNLAISNQFPGALAVQITKDKKEFSIHLDSSICAKHGENASSMAGFDIQAFGRQLAYILRTETKFKNLKINKTSAGLTVTLIGKTLATGLKLEDQIAVGRRLALVGSAGAVRSGGDTAYGANFEVRLRSKEFPIEQEVSTFCLSLLKWRGNLGLMASLQSQFNVGQDSKVAVRVGLNNRRSGQITVKTNSSELNVALIGVVPILVSLFRSIYPSGA